MNSRFLYLYRDAGNWKNYGEVVFDGASTESLKERLVATLATDDLFIAEQVRVPDLSFEDWPDEADDHFWHEFFAFEETGDAATDEHGRSIQNFVEECEAAAREGWRVFHAPGRKPYHGCATRKLYA